MLPLLLTEAVARRYSVKNVFLEILQNSQKNNCTRVSFLKKETLAQVFSCEFFEIPKNTFSYRTHPVAAPVVNDQINGKLSVSFNDYFKRTSNRHNCNTKAYGQNSINNRAMSDWNELLKHIHLESDDTLIQK